MKTEAPRLWPFRSRVRWDSADAGVRSPRRQKEKRPAAGRDREVDPAARLVSGWEERWSKEAHPALAVAIVSPLAARTIHFAQSEKSEQSETGRRASRDKRISDPSKNFADHSLDRAQDSAFPFCLPISQTAYTPSDG